MTVPLSRAWLALAILGGCTSVCRGDDAPKTSPRPLFNGKNLEGWTIFIRHVDESGTPQPKLDPHADPGGVFQVEAGAIHISGAEFGCLTTKDEFSDYRLKLEMKWGEKRWLDRKDKQRDSGILLHCTGPDQIWTKSIECQVREGDCGDFWLLGGTSLTIDGKVEKTMRKKKKDAEKPRGEWNTIEVVCDGRKITNIVNGVVVNEGIDASETRGRILLQSEGAEVWYRKVELLPLKP